MTKTKELVQEMEVKNDGVNQQTAERQKATNENVEETKTEVVEELTLEQKIKAIKGKITEQEKTIEKAKEDLKGLTKTLRELTKIQDKINSIKL